MEGRANFNSCSHNLHLCKIILVTIKGSISTIIRAVLSDQSHCVNANNVLPIDTFKNHLFAKIDIKYIKTLKI